MIDVFWYFLSLVLLVALLASLYALIKWFLNANIKRLSAEFDEKLRNHTNKMSKFRQDFAEFAHEPRDVVSGALGEIGIEGIMNELGIDPKLLSNPLVKGLIDKYAPRLIEQLSKGKNGITTQSQESPLL